MKTLLLVLGLLAITRAAAQSNLTLEQTPAGRLKAGLSAPGAKRIGLQFRWDMANATPWLNWGTSTSATNDSLEMPFPAAATRFFRVNAEAPENNGGSVFDPSRVAVIRLNVAMSNYVILTNIVGGDSSIANNDGEYVPAEFEFDGLQLANVAVRRKGNSSGLRVDPSRPNYIPLKVDFNRYVDGQKLKGLKKVNLHVASSSSGGSGLEDYLGYGAFQEFGVPAPRTGWADVWLNGEYVGLYTTVEQVDDRFLARCFGSPEGNLYKPESPAGTLEWQGTNYLSYTNANFDRGDDETHGAFIGFVQAINQRPASEFASLMDLSGIQACIAGWFALGAWDNYLAMAHNFYLYEAKPGVMTLFPWDMNDSMGNSTNLFVSSLGGGGIGGGLTNGLPGGMTNFPGGLTNGLPGGMTNFPGGMTNGLPGGMTNFPGGGTNDPNFGGGPLTSTNRPLTDKLFAYPPTRRRHLELVAEFLAGSGSRPRLESRIDAVQAVLTNRLISTTVLTLKSNITARTTGLDAQLRAEGIIR